MDASEHDGVRSDGAAEGADGQRADAHPTPDPAAQGRPGGEILIVTGMSGAGRSTVANALEDMGWYVVDNLPPQMLRPMLEMSGLASNALPRVAAVVDVRGGSLFTDLPDAMRTLRHARDQVRLVFLDASDDVLVRRYEAVRRPHPLQGEGTVVDGIRRERERVLSIRESADVVIDTTDLNVHQLASRVVELFSEKGAARHTLTVMSFGFKYGLPPDADLVADMRFIPNPFWEEGLRALTGRDEPVRAFVMAQPGVEEFLDAYTAAVSTVIAGYQRENKRHSVLAIGCTGGKHRSVVIAAELGARLDEIDGVAVRVAHRDLGRE